MVPADVVPDAVNAQAMQNAQVVLDTCGERCRRRIYGTYNELFVGLRATDAEPAGRGYGAGLTTEGFQIRRWDDPNGGSTITLTVSRGGAPLVTLSTATSPAAPRCSGSVVVRSRHSGTEDPGGPDGSRADGQSSSGTSLYLWRRSDRCE
jgi:hypothetical protein